MRRAPAPGGAPQANRHPRPWGWLAARLSGDALVPPAEVMDTISHGEVVSHRFEIKL
jgi:hypothetical protein